MKKGFTLVELIVVICLLVIFLLFCIPYCSGGVGGLGKHDTVTCIVKSKHIDTRGGKSHYMVTTTQGTFEVDNGPALGVWNADEIYGNILVEHKYLFEIAGAKFVNPIAQYYPYIIRAEEQ